MSTTRGIATLGIVEARLGSGVRGKVSRKLGGKSLLEWIVRQASDSARLSHVVVVSGDAECDRQLAECVPGDVAFVASGGRDVLATYVAAVQEHSAEAIVRVCADAPFVDPVLIDRLVRTADEHPRCDYIGYSLADGRPAIFSPVGVFAEWCRADALRRADRAATDTRDRQLPTRFVYSHPEQFRVRLVEAPEALDREDLRLTIDSEEDWERTQAIYEALGPEGMDWQRVTDMLDHHPALRQRMAVLNQSGC